jgi:hypothetical protein
MKKAGILKRAIAAMPDDTDLYVRTENDISYRLESIDITTNTITLCVRIMEKE